MAELGYSFTWLTELPEKLEKLNGYSYEAAASRVRKKGNTNIMLKTDEGFQVELAAMALGVTPADIREAPLKLYSQVIQTVMNFLLAPPDSETNEISEA